MNYYRNPLLFGEHADPSIVRDGEDYFMVFSSCFGNDGLMQMWHSTDLLGWEPVYYVLENSGLENAWAPELVKYKDIWYIYSYSPGTGCFVTWTEDIRKGCWRSPVMLEGIKGIDPGHVADEDGNRYLAVSGNYLYPLSGDGLSVIGEGVKICQEWKIPDEINVEGSCPEGPKFFCKDGYYYLTIAQGGTVGPPTSHGTVSYRARNIYGPYEMSPYTPVIHTCSRKETWWSKGHSTVFQAKDGNWYMVYHAIENAHRYAGRCTLLMPVQWDENGWYYVSAEDSVRIPCPEGMKKKDLSPYLQYRAGMKEFSVLYNFCTRQARKNLEFTPDEIKAVCPGKDIPGMEGMVTYLPQSHFFSMTATFETEPEAAISLGVWFGDRLNCGVYAIGDTIGLFRHGKFQFPQENICAGTGKLMLRMVVDEGTVSYWYKSWEETDWHKLIHSYDVADWNPNVSEGFGYARANIQFFGKGTVRIKKLEYKNLQTDMIEETL